MALAGFAVPFYPKEDVEAVADEIAEAAREALVDWRNKIGRGLAANKLESVEIEFFCMPLPSAQDFRDAFLEAMGLKR